MGPACPITVSPSKIEHLRIPIDVVTNSISSKRRREVTIPVGVSPHDMDEDGTETREDHAMRIGQNNRCQLCP